MTLTIAHTVDDALTAMAQGARPIAGGTDLVVGHRQGKAPLPAQLVAIDRLTELSRVELASDQIRIGSGVTHADLMIDPIVVGRLTAVADAAALVGSPATRNVGTIGGNIMNGSPAMDTGAPLVVLGAEAVLRTETSERRVSLADLWTGPGTVSAQADELCTGLVISTPTTQHGSAYVRLEYRRAMEIAIVGAAASVSFDGDRITSLRVALTAVAPTIREVKGLDDVVDQPSFVGTGGVIVPEVLSRIGSLASQQATPISDLRASDRYRSHVVGVMARRAVDAAARRAAGEEISVPVNRAIGIGAQR